MAKSMIIVLSIAFILSIASSSFSASAACASCVQEGDWGESASNFLEGKPINDNPLAFGPKAEREANSKLSLESNAKTEDNDTSNQSSIETPEVDIKLNSINAEPDSVNSGDSVQITAVFGDKSFETTESLTKTTNSDKSANDSETMLTATASILDATEKEVGKVNLIKSSENAYSGVWKAEVPTGFYNVTLAVSSLQASVTLLDALQIEVNAADNATTSSPNDKNLSQS
jgi:hypothetical protein